MIRINLLGTPKAKARRLPKVTHVGALIADAVDLGHRYRVRRRLHFMYWRAQNQHEKIQVDLRAADKQLAALAGVKAAYHAEAKRGRRAQA